MIIFLDKLHVDKLLFILCYSEGNYDRVITIIDDLLVRRQYNYHITKCKFYKL